MSNNANLYNAALAGAAAGVSSRWITNTSSASYAEQAALVTGFAVAFDAGIPPIVGGGSKGQADCVESICNAFWTDRNVQSGTDLATTAAPLIALYNALAPTIEPDGGTPGTSAPLPNTYWVSPLAVGSTEDGSSANPFLTAQAGVDKLETDGVPGTLLLACAGAAYNGESILVSSQNIQLIGYGPSNGVGRPFFTNITVQGGVNFSAQNLGAVFFHAPVGSGVTLDFYNVTLLAGEYADCTIRSCAYSQVTLPADHLSGPGTVVLESATHCSIGFIGTFGIPFSSATIHDCIGIAGDIGINANTINVFDSVCGQIICDNALNAQGSTFSGEVAVTISSRLDMFSLQSIRNNGQPFVFGVLTITDPPPTEEITVATPALVAGVLGYVDVDLSTSSLAPLPLGTQIQAEPQVDLVPGGATNGFYINARISALNTARLAFVGTLPGGGIAFLFTKLSQP